MQSSWLIGQYPAFPLIDGNHTVDVVVVGGGITGISIAYELKKRGLKVCVLERDRIAHSDTGHSSAHLTYITDRPLHRLASEVGLHAAIAVWHAGEAALNLIYDTVEQEGLSCGYRRVSGYYHVTPMGMDDDESEVRREAQLLARTRFDTTVQESVPLFGRPGVEFLGQAKFHPVDYTISLAQLVHGGGCTVFEHSQVTDFEADTFHIRSNGWRVSAKSVVIATHTPVLGAMRAIQAATFQSKLYPYTTYALRVRMPKSVVPEALFWDTHVPYYYVRIDAGEDCDYAIVGGKDHKTGQALQPERSLNELQSYVSSFLPAPQVVQRWSGQVIETYDSLPFIGRLTDNLYVATGFGGNGMTFGALSGLIIAQEIVGKMTPWSDLFSPHRKGILAGGFRYLRENFDYPFYMVMDRIAPQEMSALGNVEKDSGAIVQIAGKRVAAYRSEDGVLHMLSPVCTHLGCIVHWNETERSWDCPCHGSRYTPLGAVLAGPAYQPLDPLHRTSSPEGASLL